MVTPSGLFTAKRVIMGSTAAVAYAQHVAEGVMKPVLGKGVHAWMDDILGYATKDAKVLNILSVSLQRCNTDGVKRSAENCTSIHYFTIRCGKKTSSVGISHCESRVQSLCELETSKTAVELQQFCV